MNTLLLSRVMMYFHCCSCKMSVFFLSTHLLGKHYLSSGYEFFLLQPLMIFISSAISLCTIFTLIISLSNLFLSRTSDTMSAVFCPKAPKIRELKQPEQYQIKSLMRKTVIAVYVRIFFYICVILCKTRMCVKWIKQMTKAIFLFPFGIEHSHEIFSLSMLN